MTVAAEEWVRAAMTDDAVVAELLLRLKQDAPVRPEAVIPLRWGLRLPRSKSLAAAAVAHPVRFDFVARKEGESSSARCSPTTPLSWSGGGGAASSSTADGGLEDSTGFSPSAVRSKGIAASTETNSTTTKKSRKKKTFAELKEEESSLLKERTHLNKELATLRATLKEQSARNENLKRIKLDLNVEATKQEKSICRQHEPKEESSSNLISSTLHIASKIDKNPERDACETNSPVSSHDRPVFLFDLNVMPPEESVTETSCQMR